MRDGYHAGRARPSFPWISGRVPTLSRPKVLNRVPITRHPLQVLSAPTSSTRTLEMLFSRKHQRQQLKWDESETRLGTKGVAFLRDGLSGPAPAARP